MKKCVFIASLAGLLCALTPVAADAGVPQWPQAHKVTQAHATLRKSSKPPKRDQVHRGGLDGSITLIQLISTRRSHDEKHKDQATPQDSVAQVRASSEAAEPRSPAALTARAVESLPPHWGSTHLCI